MPICVLFLAELRIVVAPYLHLDRQVSITINVEANAVFCGIAQFHDVGSFKIDDLGRKILNRGLTITDYKTQNIVKAGLEALYELFDFSRRLLIGILSALNFPSFFAA